MKNPTADCRNENNDFDFRMETVTAKMGERWLSASIRRL